MTMSAAVPDDVVAAETGGDVLEEIARQVLWLSTAIIHHANRVRVTSSGVKVGGHQSSSASIASAVAIDRSCPMMSTSLTAWKL